jgi:hypothetical protein
LRCRLDFPPSKATARRLSGSVAVAPSISIEISPSARTDIDTPAGFAAIASSECLLPRKRNAAAHLAPSYCSKLD